MKKLFFILVIFIFSAQFIHAQEESDSTTVVKKKTKSLPNLPGGNWEKYQDYTGMLTEDGQSLGKYNGPKRKIDSQSNTGTWTTGWLIPGTPIVTADSDEKDGGFSVFKIFQCYNNSRIHGGAPIKRSELIKVVSYAELQRLKKGTGIAGIGKEDFLKLSELLERAFGDGGEIETIGDQLTKLNDKYDLLEKSINLRRASLGFGGEKEEKLESSFDWLWWVLGGAVIVTLGALTYKLLQQKDNSGPTNIYVNTPNGPIISPGARCPGPGIRVFFSF